MSSIFPDRIETERLVLTPLTPEDVDALDLYEHVRVGAPAIGDVTEHLPWDPHRTPEETAEFIERSGERRSEREGAEYVVRPREGEDGAGEIAGCTGLDVDWDRERAELGLWLRKRFWGRGYSAERAVALAEVAFDRLDLGVLAVSHAVGNENSRRAIETYVDRLGGSREGRIHNGVVVDDEPVDTIRYSVTAEAWRDRA